MNFVLAFIFSILYYVLFVATNVLSGLSVKALSVVYTIMIQIITINIGLGVFNLIPLPPLDGSKVLMNFLGYNAKQWFYRNAFVLLWVTGLLSSLLAPIFSGVFTGITWLAFKIVSIFM